MTRKIEIGDYVKVSNNGEAFWCIVDGFGDEGMLVRVNNHVRMQDFEAHDTIAIKESDVIVSLPKDATREDFLNWHKFKAPEREGE